MPDLRYHLHQADLGLLRIYAQHWGVEGPLPDAPAAATALAAAMQQPAQVEAVVLRLPDEARDALRALQRHRGQMPWADFVRRFGPFREMGPARREREKPHEHPQSAAEVLWYTGLVGRAFLPTEQGPVEFAYLPEDLLPHLPATPAMPAEPLGRPATPTEAAHPLPLSDRILDHLTAYLAARRGHRDPQRLPDRGQWPYTAAHLQALAQAAGLLSAEGEVLTQAAREFLAAPRGAALARLFHAWRNSPTDDLTLVPGLQVETPPPRDPRLLRQTILDWAASLPPDTWWSVEGLIAAVQQCCPDFQRPVPGDFDSWRIYEKDTGRVLRGWEHWWAVDGALLRFILTGVLAWLGVLSLAAPAEGDEPTAFRLSPWGKALLAGQTPPSSFTETEPLALRSDGRIFAAWRTPRTVRYHLTRFADWESASGRGYHFRLSAAALARAAEQHLQPQQVLGLLRQYATVVPPAVAQAIQRWEAHGPQARVRALTVLQVSDPAILEALRRSRAARYLGESLNPTTVVVPTEARHPLLTTLAELGYFGEDASPSTPLPDHQEKGE